MFISVSSNIGFSFHPYFVYTRFFLKVPLLFAVIIFKKFSLLFQWQKVPWLFITIFCITSNFLIRVKSLNEVNFYNQEFGWGCENMRMRTTVILLFVKIIECHFSVCFLLIFFLKHLRTTQCFIPRLSTRGELMENSYNIGYGLQIAFHLLDFLGIIWQWIFPLCFWDCTNKLSFSYL